MSNLIQIKRSATTAAPASLNPGELAYSNSAQVMYIGSTDGASVVAIGGARNPGTLTANQALVANSSSGINSIQVGNVVMVGASQTLNANGSVGTVGQVLVSGGTGANAYWSTLAASVAGSNTYIQFNDSSSFGGSSGLTFDKGTTRLTANNFTATSTANLGAVGNVKITGGTANYVLQTDGTGNLSWVAQSGGSGTPGGSNTQLQFNNGGSFGGIANVTYDGSNISLGSISTVKIQGGLNNEIVSTDGTGNLSFRSIALNLSVGTHTVPSYVPVTNSTFQVLSRTGNVTVNLY